MESSEDWNQFCPMRLGNEYFSKAIDARGLLEELMEVIRRASSILIRILIPIVMVGTIFPIGRHKDTKSRRFLIQKEAHSHMVCPCGTA